jgi:hypothetical protein
LPYHAHELKPYSFSLEKTDYLASMRYEWNLIL